MKKFLAIITLLIVTIVTSACQSKSGQLTCSITTTPNENTTLSSEYIINYKNNYVTKLKTKEIITSETKEDLETYKEALNAAYSSYNDIEYYSNTVSIEDNNLISSTIINYEKIDTNKLIEIDSNNHSLIKNGKVSIKDLKDMYIKNGCTCK